MSTPPTGEGVVFSGDGVSKSAAEIGERISALADSGASVLIVHGENDVIVPASNSRALAKLLGAELKIVPACGHMPHEEAPEEFIDIVRNFIERASA